MPDCVFCRILRSEAEASIIHRDEACTAFMTIEPITEGHALVVPNRHHVNIFDLPADTAAHMFEVAQSIAKAYPRTGIRCEGVNIVMCNGAAASQTVFHAHLHVSPRYVGDGFSWNMPPGFHAPPGRPELDRVAATLARAFGYNEE